jgi:CheY-like chemotaxis protein
MGRRFGSGAQKMISSLGQGYCAFCERTQRIFAFQHAGALVNRCQQCGFPAKRILPASVPGETDPLRILCIDDDQLFLEQAKDLLGEQGHTVLLAHDGESGVGLAGRELPDLILLDLIMPGLHGFEVCGAIKATPELAAIPIVILTRLNNPQLNSRAFESGALLAVQKSAAGQDVQRMIRAVRVLTQGEGPFSPRATATRSTSDA